MPLNNAKKITLFQGTSYLLRDDFTDTRAAGAVNGTYATDGRNLRTVQDTNSKFSIDVNGLALATGQAATDSLEYPLFSRLPGRTILWRVTPATTGNFQIGFLGNYFLFRGTGALAAVGTGLATLNVMDAFSTGVTYTLAQIMRLGGYGYLWLAQGGALTNWTLLYAGGTESSANYPWLESQVTTTVLTARFARIPLRLVNLLPLASDSFNRADGAIGSTDGLGTSEAGGAAWPWTNQVGAVAISGNKAKATSLAGGIAICTVPVPTAHVFLQAALTRGTTGVGIVLRYQDAQNYVYIRRVVTNIELHKVTTAGGDATVLTTAAAEVAGALLQASFDQTKLRHYYNAALVGTEQTISDAALQSSLNMGLIFFDTDSSAGNFVVWARGNSENPYGSLLNGFTA